MKPYHSNIPPTKIQKSTLSVIVMIELVVVPWLQQAQEAHKMRLFQFSN